MLKWGYTILVMLYVGMCSYFGVWEYALMPLVMVGIIWSIGD